MNQTNAPEIPGADEVVLWFGYWPSFHDAELLDLKLSRKGQSQLRVHTWHMSEQTYEKEGRHYFILEKHAVVTFELEQIVNLDLSGFNGQNILFELKIEPNSAGLRLSLDACCGIDGYIEAKKIQISLSQGKPQDE